MVSDRSPGWRASGASAGGAGLSGAMGDESGYEMVKIPAGTYPLGCTPRQSDCAFDEARHEVVLVHGFSIGRTEVTQGLWRWVMGSNPSYFSSCGDDCPVEQVGWADAAHFANALSAKEGLEVCYQISGESVVWSRGLACSGYRLPTEAEWEVAARGGRDTVYAGGRSAGQVAWYAANAQGTTHPVGSKTPNRFGLSDMSGNVWEWTWDGYGAYWPTSVDPLGAPTASPRVLRGGSYMDESVRMLARGRNAPTDRSPAIGFRLVRSEP